MHDQDRQASAWDATVSADPAHEDFSFSIAGRKYFVVGLHPAASRLSRCAPVPCLVFNFHNQFEALKQSGKFSVMQTAIRIRDKALQGFLNPYWRASAMHLKRASTPGVPSMTSGIAGSKPGVLSVHEPHQGSRRIAPQSGVTFKLRQGEVLRITDPLGQQVADLFAFAQSNFACSLSSGRSIDYASKIYFTTGDVLYANDSQRMFTIGKDTVGRHDFLLTPCSQETFEILYKHQGHHPSCFENLYTALAPYDIRPEQIATTLNVFMNVEVTPDGAVAVKAPRSQPGGFVELRAEMDMVCALTSCSAENSNNGSFKPIDYEIVTRAGQRNVESVPCGSARPMTSLAMVRHRTDCHSSDGQPYAKRGPT